jgi:septum formation protein
MSLPDQHAFVYLASQSPRRVQLLDQLSVQHRPLLPGRDENAEALEVGRSGETAMEYVQRVALRKLAAARKRLDKRRLPVAPILVADTTVVLGRRVLGKPTGPDDAKAMLRALSGRTHRVLTAVVVGTTGQHYLAVSTSKVRFAELSDLTIRRYVDSGEPRGKAGSYAIQGRMAAWIQRIEGSYSGVMGLPLHETVQLLARARVRLDV